MASICPIAPNTKNMLSQREQTRQICQEATSPRTSRPLTPLRDHHTPTSISNRRGIDFNLPRFDELVSAQSQCSTAPRITNSPLDAQSQCATQLSKLADRPHGQSAQRQVLRSHSLGPLTPPHDIEVSIWSGKEMKPPPTDAQTASADQTSAGKDVPTLGRGLSLSTSPLSTPQTHLHMTPQRLSHIPWLDRALKSIGQSSALLADLQYIEFASQVLPNHASDRRILKTSELICDHLQQTVTDLQGITVTHAITVPQSQVVEDFPKSPPSTPNFVVSNGYFEEPRIITKAANVPLYHGHPQRMQEAGVQIQRRIMARSIVDVALLERYIPPTTADEMADLFNADSYRSYLADRLSELVIGSGSLILVYPTLSGGRTFARKLIAPILDPLLREMSILRGLDTNAAQKLGLMESVDAMLDFDEMKAKVDVLCRNMSTRTRALPIRSSYNVVHSEIAQAYLDRSTWMTWFVEQEQPRLKRNLVDYHKDGGRLPQGDGGSSELTAGMLTREIIEGLQKSKCEVAANAGIEVGVFVIRRQRD